MDPRILIFGLFVTILANKNEFVAGVVIKFSNAVCKSLNESWLIIHTCRIRAINRYTNIFNYNATVLYPVNELKGRFQVFKRENGYKPWLYDFFIDFCQYLRKPNNPAVIFIFNQIKNFTNFLDQKCPISGTKTINGLYLNPKTFNLPLPTGEYMINTTWLFNKKLTVVVYISFQFVEDLI